MAVSQEVLGILVRLEGKTAFISGVREEQAAMAGFTRAQREAAGAADAQAAANARNASTAALVRKGFLGLGLVVAGSIVEGVKMSIEFNKQLEMIHTQAGASQAEVGKMKTAILELHGVTQSPVELAEGLYHLESIGLRGAKAFDALKVAAHGATIGNAHLEETASALGAAWIVNIKGAGDLHHTMGVLNATVGAGNMRMNQLVEALGTGILPAAKLAGLSIQDVSAALAVLTDEGYAPSSAAAQLATALHFLYAPTAKATKALDGMGLTQAELVKTMHGPDGLHNALKLLYDHLQSISDPAERIQRLGEIFPGGRGRVLLVLLNQIERLDMKKKQIEGTSGNFDEALKRSMEQPANKIAEAWSNLRKELIKLGEAVEGPATKALVGLAGAGVEVIKVIMSLTDHGKLLVPIILALAGGWAAYKTAVVLTNLGLLAWEAMQAGLAAAAAAEIIGIEGLTGAFIGLGVAMDTAGIGLVFLAITALVVATYMVVKNFNAIKNWIEHNWSKIIKILFGPFGQLVVYVAQRFIHIKGTINDVIHWVEKAWARLGYILTHPFDWLWSKAKWVFDHVKKEAEHLPNMLTKQIPLVGGPLASLGHEIGLPGFAAGGTMSGSGWARINENTPGETVWLPGGTTVQPSPAGSLQGTRAHIPNPTRVPGEGALPRFDLSAVFVLPNGQVLTSLVTKELQVKKSRL